MQIAIISDIHGNYRALEAVLNDFSKYDIDEIWILGDLIGYYSGASEVITLIKSCGIPYQIVKGNHEVMLQKAESGELDWHQITQKYGPALKRASECLSSEEKEWLYDLPEEKIMTLHERSIILTHAPGGPDGAYVYPDTEYLTVLKYFEADLSYDHMFFGHTHRPLVTYVKNTLIINPGSVGQPRRRGGLADWGLFNLSNYVYQSLDSQYDVTSLIQELEKDSESVPYLSEVLKR